MNGKQPFRLLCHAVKMVRRNLRSYALLSVTIVLSFSLLLGYFLYTDGTLYNQYKGVFSKRRGDVCFFIRQKRESQNLNMIIEKLNHMEDTVYYTAPYYSLGSSTIQYLVDDKSAEDAFPLGIYWLHALMVPNYVWTDGIECCLDECPEIVWLDGAEHSDFILDEDEVILSEKIYALLFSHGEEPVFKLRTTALRAEYQLRVAGYYRDDRPLEYSNDCVIRAPIMFLSSQFPDWAGLNDPSSWTECLYEDENVYVVTHSTHPERVVELAKSMRANNIFINYEEHNQAIHDIQSALKTKAMIASAMLLILGINLYSSFSNALNARKFEIGVKRATGASAWSIVKQFLYEGVIVMLTNILLSMLLVMNGALIFKIIYEHFPDQWGEFHQWTIYLSPYSMGMFATCAISLTLVFSLIFAYESTKVEIVRYLKAE